MRYDGSTNRPSSFGRVLQSRYKSKRYSRSFFNPHGFVQFPRPVGIETSVSMSEIPEQQRTFSLVRRVMFLALLTKPHTRFLLAEVIFSRSLFLFSMLRSLASHQQKQPQWTHNSVGFSRLPTEHLRTVCSGEST